MAAPPSPTPRLVAGSAFLGGLRAGVGSVFVLVLFGTYISLGALAHDIGFSSLWLALSTMLVWAAPAQVIILMAMSTGGAPVEIAMAVSLSGIRLLPMVVALLPIVKAPATRFVDLILPAHFTAISMWIESLRLAPKLPHAARIPFVNGIGAAFMGTAVIAGTIGYYLASLLPVVLVSALLFLTPMSFLSSAVRSSRILSDRLALVIGLFMAPLLAWFEIALDLMWTGVVGGTLAYAAHRLREAFR